MVVTAEVLGVGSLLAKIEALGGNVERSLKKAVKQGAKKVQGDAKLLVAVDKGELRESIKEETRKRNGKIQGRVFTNAKHAAYIEFGTGPTGEEFKHLIAETMRSRISYRQDPWWIHESQIDIQTAEKYKFPKIETSEGIFYFSSGQPAQPYLYPAIAQNKEIILRIIKNKLKEDLRRLRSR